MAVALPAYAQLVNRETFEQRHSTKPLTKAQLWAMACTGLLSTNNRERLDLLWCKEPTARNTQAAKEILSEWWSVNDRSELMPCIQSLETKGMREAYDLFVMAQSNPRLSGALIIQLKMRYKPSYEKKWKLVADNKGTWSKSLIGWDFCRIISICRWAVLCEYMTEEEAWAKVMPAARRVQKTFSSWEELADNYILGRRFWQVDDDARHYEQLKFHLLTNPKSPWVTLPWKTDLSKGAQTAGY